MYTIGKVSEITGMSRDKLRYYEEKGILTPSKNESNGYREYKITDMDTILAIEYYRALDFDMKTIRNVLYENDLDSIEEVTDRKYDHVLDEISRLTSIKERIERFQQSIHAIKMYQNKFTVKEMPAFEVIGEISDFRSYEEYEYVGNQPMLRTLKRYLAFDDSGLVSSKMLVTREVNEKSVEKHILTYQKCAYTVVEDSSLSEDLIEKTFDRTKKWMSKTGNRPEGTAIINLLTIGKIKASNNETSQSKSYLEIYIPIV